MSNHNKSVLTFKNESVSFENIYNLHISDLLSYGISLGFDEDTCRDAVHDMFFKMYEDKNKLVHIKDAKSYLFRCFRNRLFNIYNKASKITPLTDENIQFTTNVTVLDTIITEEERNKLQQVVSDLLESLTPRQREAIYLRYMQEMDYEDISEILNMNSNSARRLVHRGIKALRENESISKNIFLFFTFYFFHF
jgi:RNA polymerase sigma factor (sigma-70 family)